jgi:hypothetical protein
MAAEAAKGNKIKADKDQIAALARSFRDKLTRGTYKYAAATFPFEVKNGTVRFKPTALAGPGVETTVNGYVELASLKLDSEWTMALPGGDAMPSISLVLAGPLANAGAIAPAIDVAAIENYLTMRRMQEDVERLENLDVSGRTPPPAPEPPTAPLVDAKPDDAAEPVPSAKVEPESAPPLPSPAPKPHTAGVEKPNGAPTAKVEPAPWEPQTAPEPGSAESTSVPAESPGAATAQDQPTPAAADQGTASPAGPRPPVRNRKAPAAPDDWKKGIGIFGGG